MINKNYIEQYKILHKTIRYGVTSNDMLSIIKPLVKEVMPGSLLDYGCGQSNLMDLLKDDLGNKAKCFRYDPAIDKYSKMPVEKVDLVTCTDVLEHVPQESLRKILEDIHSLSCNVIFSVSLIKAGTILPNGENAHCTVKLKEWWLGFLNAFFDKITDCCDLNSQFVCATWPVNETTKKELSERTKGPIRKKRWFFFK